MEKEKIEIKRLVCPIKSTPMDSEYCNKEKCALFDRTIEECCFCFLKYLEKLRN